MNFGAQIECCERYSVHLKHASGSGVEVPGRMMILSAFETDGIDRIIQGYFNIIIVSDRAPQRHTTSSSDTFRNGSLMAFVIMTKSFFF